MNFGHDARVDHRAAKAAADRLTRAGQQAPGAIAPRRTRTSVAKVSWPTEARNGYVERRDQIRRD